MNLDIDSWKPFITKRIFSKLENGKASQQVLSEGEGCFYVGAKRENNGVMIHCAEDESIMTKGNCVVFICNGQGSVGFANYMDVDFIGTTDVVAGYNEHLNPWIGTFLATIYSQERPKYSFGRKWKTHLKDTEVNLPIKHNADNTPFIDEKCEYSDEGYVPDWQFMENYTKSLHYKPLTTQNCSKSTPKLHVENWKEFAISSLFKMKRGHTLKVEDKEDYEGDQPCVNGTVDNNGIQYYVDDDIKTLGFEKISAPALSIVRVGNGGKTFLQTDDFYVADNAYALIPIKEMSNEVLLFISAILDLEQPKYSYGRTVTNNYADTKIKLPVNKSGDIDYVFMECYMKSLPYGDRL